MHSFEHAFRIPLHHRLEQIKTRACGGRVTAIYWDHEEYDAHGRLVARYHTFREVSEAGEGGCGSGASTTAMAAWLRLRT
jgi:hypothetical protein